MRRCGRDRVWVLVLGGLSGPALAGEEAGTKARPGRGEVEGFRLARAAEVDLVEEASRGEDAEAASSASEKNVFGLPTGLHDEPLVTDRPDFTESTDAVPVGRLQLEMGYTFTKDNEPGVRARDHTTPELLLRLGLIEDVELRLGWDGYGFTHTRETFTEREGGGYHTRSVTGWTQGANDMTVGAKVKLLEQDGLVPHFGVIGELSLPSGSVGLSSGDVDPGVVLAWAYDVTDRFAVAGNVGIASATSDAKRFVQTSASLTGAYALTDRLGVYLEWFGIYPSDRRAGPSNNLNTGLTYLITDNLQADWRIGAGLSHDAPDFFTGVGLCFRF